MSKQTGAPKKAPGEYRNISRHARTTSSLESVPAGEIAQNGLDPDHPHDKALVDEGAFGKVTTDEETS